MAWDPPPSGATSVWVFGQEALNGVPFATTNPISTSFDLTTIGITNAAFGRTSQTAAAWSAMFLAEFSIFI
jgi:hypothetical protein